MKKVTFYTKGEECCSVDVQSSQYDKFTKLIGSLCIHASRTGLDFQFSTESGEELKESELASEMLSQITRMEKRLLDEIHECIASADGEIKEKEEDGWVLEHDTDMTLHRIFQDENGIDYAEIEETYDGKTNKIRLFKLDIYNLIDIYSWTKEQLTGRK